MSKFFYLRVLVLLIALVGVFYVIHEMTPAKIQAGLENAGLNSTEGSKTTTPAFSSETIDLCKTRVHAIVWPDGRKIQEEKSGMKTKWQAYNLTPEDVGTMDIEKWLSLHCSTPATVSKTTQTPTNEMVRFDYIDGSHESLFHGGGNLYAFRGKTFDSPELTKAFTDLIQVANLEPRGP